MATEAWKPTVSDEIAAADEVTIAPVRPDGTLLPYTMIWVYVRGPMVSRAAIAATLRLVPR